MVVNDSSEETAGNGKQNKASVLLTPTLSHQPFNNEIKKEDFVGKNYRINDNEKSVTTPPPKNDFWNIHDTLEIKNKRIVDIIDDFFRDKNSFNHEESSGSIEGNDAIHLLEILNNCISEGEQPIITFYERCKDETGHGQLILNQLSPLSRECDS